MENLKYITMNDQMKMPTIGFGTWCISDEEAPEVISSAITAGYRSIDTAKIYANETGVGAGIKASGVNRAELFIATKVWHTEQGYDATLRAMDESLRKLKLDYVDLYMIHWPMPNLDKYVATWKALIRLRTEGLCKSIGVCNFNIDYIERLIHETGIVPAVNQVELHPYFQQKELREFHQKHNIITESYSPISRGTVLEDTLINTLAKKYNKTAAQIVLRWHFENGLVAIPKSQNPKRILENLDIFGFNLSAEDLVEMAKLDRTNGRTGMDPALAIF